MRAVDTNILVRLITRDDAEQTSTAEAFIHRGAWVSHLVLVETMWVLSASYELPAESLITALKLLLNHQQLVIQDRHLVAAALAQFEQHPALGFSDCLILESARQAGHLPLGTFDRRLARLDGAQKL